MEKKIGEIGDSHWLSDERSEIIVLGLTQDSQSDSGDSVKFLGKTLTLDYDYESGSEKIDECELNNCNLHNHVKESCDVCHHKKFPKETIKEKFGDDVRTCCAGHGYIFKDYCEVTNFLINIIYRLQR